MNVCNEPDCNRRCGDERAMCDTHTRRLLAAAFGRPAEARTPAPLGGLASPPPAARPARFVDIVSGAARTATRA